MTDLEKNNIIDAPMGVFDTHKLLYTLNYENSAKGHKVIFTNRKDEEQSIILERLEIGTSPVSCKLYDDEGNRHIVPFMRVKFIYKDNELVWDNCDNEAAKKVKIIKGYD